MKIPSMPKTEITFDEDGSITIRQESQHGDDDHYVYFPVEMARTITDEIMRLAESAGPRSEEPPEIAPG